MTLHRFFVEPAKMSGERFPIPDDIEHQVRRVLRLGDGDRLLLLDGLGWQTAVRLLGGDCVVEERGPAGGEPAHRLEIWQALLRGDHLEPVVRHATEVGAAAFRLFTSERCVARDLSPRRLDRLRAVAREAAEQSERGIVPTVAAPMPLGDAVRAASRPAALLYERSEGPRLTDVELPASVFIGPEGGFSAGEVAAAEEAGIAAVGLGPRILRSESVSVAAAAVVLSRSGDFA